MAANGLIWWSTPRATFGLVVYNAVVIDAAPIARRWAMGQDARQLWREGRRQGADLRWLPARLGKELSEARRSVSQMGQWHHLMPHEPRQCPNGHPFTPGAFSRSWVKCKCPGAGAGEGHQKMYCRTCRAGVMPTNHVEQE